MVAAVGAVKEGGARGWGRDEEFIEISEGVAQFIPKLVLHGASWPAQGRGPPNAKSVVGQKVGQKAAFEVSCSGWPGGFGLQQEDCSQWSKSGGERSWHVGRENGRRQHKKTDEAAFVCC